MTRLGARLPTGLKMLLWLAFCLLPLGVLAIFASIQSTRENNLRREEQTRARVEIKAQRINVALSRSALTIRTASAAISRSPDPQLCQATLGRLSGAPALGARYALYAGGSTPRCTSPGFLPPRDLLDSKGQRSRVEIAPDGERLLFALFDASGNIEGAGEFPREGLTRLTYVTNGSTAFDLALVQGDRRMVLRDEFADSALTRPVRGSAPVADNRLRLVIALAAPPITFTELLMVALPLLILVGAALICWLLVARTILRPLHGIQRAISSYRPGDQEIVIPRRAIPAREIGELADAFNRMTRTVAGHEADLEAAVERQTRLVREVHHRVKNNLQVVASLLNIHSRGSKNEEVAAAYASIQRRVDALAVVHRNHYAELEENRGVALRSLISELSANLRATAPASASQMAIRLDIEPFYATQDVAVSVAFLITEVVEFAMFCGARSVTIALDGGAPGFARLSIHSSALRTDEPRDTVLAERFDRIVTGLGRQLRSTIDRDEASGLYALDIAVVEKAKT